MNDRKRPNIRNMGLFTIVQARGFDAAQILILSLDEYSFKKHQQRLAKYQRRMSHKVKFSKNWKKEKSKVQKVHTNIANARNDFLHKTTTTISKNHALVCVEDLQVRNILIQAQNENLGRVKASGLNDRKQPHISNIGSFTIVQSRELSRWPKFSF